MNLKTFIIFFAGVGVGAIGMRFYLKDKMENELDAAVERINSEYKRDREMLFKEAGAGTETPEEKKERAEGLRVFRSEVAKQAYDSYFNGGSDEEDAMAPAEKVETPYIISANEFATGTGLDKVTLTYYINADLLCEDGEVLENNYDELLGNEWKEHFHDEEDGVVYVRNEKMGAEYEVLLDEMDADSVREYFGYDN